MANDIGAGQNADKTIALGDGDHFASIRGQSIEKGAYRQIVGHGAIRRTHDIRHPAPRANTCPRELALRRQCPEKIDLKDEALQFHVGSDDRKAFDRVPAKQLQGLGNGCGGLHRDQVGGHHVRAGRAVKTMLCRLGLGCRQQPPQIGDTKVCGLVKLIEKRAKLLVRQAEARRRGRYILRVGLSKWIHPTRCPIIKHSR